MVVQFDDFEGKSCLPDVPKCVAIRPASAEWTNNSGKSLSRLQIPLKLGWAITIHKSQGQTLDKVWIHLENATWAAGLEYVALSRVRRLMMVD